MMSAFFIVIGASLERQKASDTFLTLWFHGKSPSYLLKISVETLFKRVQLKVMYSKTFHQNS